MLIESLSLGIEAKGAFGDTVVQKERKKVDAWLSESLESESPPFIPTAAPKLTLSQRCQLNVSRKRVIVSPLSCDDNVKDLSVELL